MKCGILGALMLASAVLGGCPNFDRGDAGDAAGDGAVRDTAQPVDAGGDVLGMTDIGVPADDGAPAFDAPSLDRAAMDATEGDVVVPTDVAADVACPSGQTRCGGTCVDTSSDSANCGACGNACSPAGATCVAGLCPCVVDLSLVDRCYVQ